MVSRGNKIWVDGNLLEGPDADRVSLLAHTLHYGVGAFEGIRAYRRQSGSSSIFRLRDHIVRLFNSCRLAMMEPRSSIDDVCDGCVAVLRDNELTEAYLRPISYLSDGSMGLLPRDNPVVTSIVAWPWGAYLGDDALNRGIRCKISAFARHHVNTALTAGKLCGQYVGSVMAKREAQLDGYDEAILLDTMGCATEGSGENLFIVDGRTLITPPLSSGILPGITRDTVLVLAREAGYEVLEQRITRDQLYLADEVFLTGTAAEVTPVREIDHRPISGGTVGDVTRRLQERYFEVVKGHDTTHPEWLTEY